MKNSLGDEAAITCDDFITSVFVEGERSQIGTHSGWERVTSEDGYTVPEIYDGGMNIRNGRALGR